MAAELTELGQDIFMRRYAYPGETKWKERAKVIAETNAAAEPDDQKEAWTDKVYKVVAEGDFIPGGRINYGSGRSARGGRHNLLNCYNLTPYDTVESIAATIGDMYKISCAGGGVGFNFSRIRPKGDMLAQHPFSAPGAVSNMKMINEVAEHVKAGKNRRVALMFMLGVTHPEIIDFLETKLNGGQLENANISVAITSRFIEAVENNEEWYFFFNNKKYYVYELDCISGVLAVEDAEGKGAVPHVSLVRVVGQSEEDALGRANEFYKTNYDDEFTNPVKIRYMAKELWDTIYRNSLECGDPGIFNIDLANEHTNVGYFQNIVVTNPCGEIPLEERPRGGGNCCLGHVNLSNMVLEDGSDIDWSKFARTTRIGIQFLDNVLEVNNFPTKECREAAMESRRIGLGMTGFAHALIKLGLVYGSEESLEFEERLFETFRNESYKKSAYLSRDKCPFPMFDRHKYLEQPFAKTLPPRIRMLIKEHGIRNAVMNTIAPCGTVSMLHSVSTGLEPIFSAMYKRRYRSDANTWKEVVVVDPIFEKYLTEGAVVTNSWLDNAREHVFVGAYDVTPEQHLAVQATAQKYVDQSISKTINLPADYEFGELSELALRYAPYLKGTTIYRAGSRGEEPLVAIPLTKENIEKYVGEAEVMAMSGAACDMNGGDCG